MEAAVTIRVQAQKVAVEKDHNVHKRSPEIYGLPKEKKDRQRHKRQIIEEGV